MTLDRAPPAGAIGGNARLRSIATSHIANFLSEAPDSGSNTLRG